MINLTIFKRNWALLILHKRGNFSSGAFSKALIFATLYHGHVNVLNKWKIAIARRHLSSRNISSESKYPLEEWIHNQIKKELKHSSEFKEILGKNRLDEVSRDDVRTYQIYRFRKQLEYVMANSVYYKSVLNKWKIEPKKIKSYEDLTKVPITEPAEVAKEPNHFLCVSQGKVMRAFTTSGTSGQIKRIFFTRDDILRIIDSISAALKTVGMREDDVLQIMFPTIASWDPGYMLDGACKIAGLHSVIADTLDVDEQIKIMHEARTTMMIGLTSFIYRVTVLAREKYDLRSLGIKAIILSAEPLPEAMRREIESSWGCKVLSQYGLTEMGLATTVECFAQDGLHVNDADFLVEAVDSQSLKHVDSRKPGELIITSLNYQGTPLIRYRTYDLSSVIEPPCSCGLKTIGKIGKIKGRLDMMRKIGMGEKIFPLMFDEAILSVSNVVNYVVYIEKSGYRDRLRFEVELIGDKEQGKKNIRDAVVQIPEIKSGIENDLLEEPIVEIVESGTLSFVPKMMSIVDLRQQYS